MENKSKVLTVTYIIEDTFKIPKHIDLENKEQVKYWEVKYNRLHIVLVDDTELTIESQGWIHHCDFKRPCSTVFPPTIELDEDEEDEE